MYIRIKKKELSMPLVETDYEHIVICDNGIPVIKGTTMKVVELVAEKIAYGWSPEELHFQHPYLTLGQIYSALAYYWDHTEEFNQDIECRLKTAEKKSKIKPSLLIDRLKFKKSQ